MQKIVTYDLCAMVLLLFLLISSFFRRMTNGRVNKCYLTIVITCIASCTFEIISVYYDNIAQSSNYFLQFLTHTLYLYFHNITAPMYLLYAIALTDTFHRFKRHSAYTYFLGIPSLVFAALFIVNIFHNFIFSLDNGIYYREWFMNVLYLIALSYSIDCVIYLIMHRKLFTKTKLLSLIIMFPTLLGAVLVQFLLPQLRLEMFAISVGLLFISTFIQRPEAIIDYNTGIYKFNAYAQDMKRSFANKKPVDVILVNVSNFLSIQEILSYDGTNDMLRLVAERIISINKQSKANADLYYLDKGRFRVVVERPHSDRTEYIAETINAAMKPKLPLNGMELNLITFVCIARCPEDIGDFNTIIEFGKDLSTKFRYTGNVLHASQLLDQSRYNLMGEIDGIIRDAVENKKFEVYYQPIYSISDGKFRSAEALVRLYNDKYGFISPELFIPVTEKSGAVHKIGMFVFEEVCKFIASDEFKELGLDYIEVNLSIVQCMQSGLAGDLLSVMKKYGVTSDQINLEITESADSQTQTIIAENLTALLNAGLTFSLDDFGTGYSNMQRMASLPLKIVKLDKTFVNFKDNPRLMIVLQNTVKMLKAMEMEIVVEGVETQELVDRFTLLDCEYIQGYFYSRPIPKHEFIEFIKNYVPEPPRVVVPETV